MLYVDGSYDMGHGWRQVLLSWPFGMTLGEECGGRLHCLALALTNPAAPLPVYSPSHVESCNRKASGTARPGVPEEPHLDDLLQAFIC